MKRAVFFIMLLLAGNVYADTVYLNNGGIIDGVIEKEDKDSIEVNMGFGSATFDKRQVKSVKRSSPEENNEKMVKWVEKKAELESKENEFEQARENRFSEAYKNWMDEQEQKKGREEGESKHIQVSRDERTKGIIVEALLNDKVKANLVLDTGASLVVLSKRIGEELGMDMAETKNGIMEFRLADGRRTKAKTIILDSVRIQDVELNKVMAAVLLDQINDPVLRDGLLGMSFLSQFNLKMDLKSMKMTLEKIGGSK
ncbi:MAG: retropepsin-like aspartic protease [Candidatus Omnitrophota bacterium]|jgi:clan AA aspartic protease (TIGR02281 family)